MSRRSWLLTLCSFLLAALATAHVVTSTWPAGGGGLRLPPQSHLLALLVALLEALARGAKLATGARALGVHMRLGTALRTCLGGDFAAAVTPARSGSEPARFLVLAESRTPVASVVMVLFVELLLEAVSLAIVAALLALLFRGSGGAMAGIVGVVGGYAGFVVFCAAAGTTLSRRNAKGPPPEWARRVGFDAGRWRRVQRWMRQVREGVAATRGADRGLLALSLAFSVAHVALRLVVLPALVLPAAPDAHLAPLVLWPLALQYGGGMAPAPGGGGMIEVAFRHTLAPTIPAAVLGASMVWWRFYTFYLYVALGAAAAGRTVLRALQGRSERKRERAAAAVA